MRALFLVPMVKMQPRSERILKLWHTSAIDIVKNAIVVPSALSVIVHTPVSI